MKKILIYLIIIILICPSLISKGGNKMASVTYQKPASMPDYVWSSMPDSSKTSFTSTPTVPTAKNLYEATTPTTTYAPLDKSSFGNGYISSDPTQNPWVTPQATTDPTAYQAIQSGLGPISQATTRDTSNDATLYSTPIGPSLAPNSQSTYTPHDYSADAHGIYDPLKQADISAIKDAYDKAISGYNAQRPLQDQYKADSLNSNDANYFTSLGNLRATMEAGGQASGAGEDITGNVALSATRGNGVNQANQTYANNLSAIDTAVRDAQNSQASQVSQAGLKWDSQIAQAIQNMQQQGTTNAQNLAGITGTYTDPTTNISTPSLALTEYNNNTATTAADKLKQTFLDTISQYGNDYDAQAQKILNDGDTSNDWQAGYLQTEHMQKLKDQATLDTQKAALATTAQQTAWNNALETWKTSGTASAEVAKVLGVAEGTKTAGFNIDGMKIGIEQQNANTSSTNASTSLANATNSANTTAANQAAAKLKSYTGQIESLYKDKTSGALDLQGIKAYIQNLNTTGQIDDTYAKQLLGYYGFNGF